MQFVERSSGKKGVSRCFLMDSGSFLESSGRNATLDVNNYFSGVLFDREHKTGPLVCMCERLLSRVK